MSDQIRISSNAAQILRKFDRLPKVVQTAVERGLKRGLILTEENVRKGAELSFSGSRSGLLSRLTSYVAKSSTGAIVIDGAIGFRKTRGFPYELSQEYGAKARLGGAMAIPVSDEARAASARGIGPRQMGAELALVKSIDNVVLLERINRFTVVVHYVLVKSIKPRLHFRESVEGSLQMISDEVVEEFDQAKRKL